MAEVSINPHDEGLPAPVVRKRRQARHVARWMLTIAVLTAIPGWTLLFVSINSARLVGVDNFARPIIAYALLIISSVTLILGLWYLLLAQVRRIARMVGEDEIENPVAVPKCPNCGWPRDLPDRFCRHCGKPLPAAGATSAEC